MPRDRIETARLVLELPSPDLAPALRDYYLRNREHHASCQATRPDRENELASIVVSTMLGHKNFDAGSGIWFVMRLRDGGGIVGDLSFSQISRGPFQAAYLGYKLDKDAVGNGYMSEALQAVVEYAFRELKLHRIMANYVPANRHSEAVLKRLGFVEEGRAKDYLFLNGRWEDHVLTALVNPRFDAGGLS